MYLSDDQDGACVRLEDVEHLCEQSKDSDQSDGRKAYYANNVMSIEFFAGLNDASSCQNGNGTYQSHDNSQQKVDSMDP